MSQLALVDFATKPSGYADVKSGQSLTESQFSARLYQRGLREQFNEAVIHNDMVRIAAILNLCDLTPVLF
jgi:hypothetical protein